MKISYTTTNEGIPSLPLRLTCVYQIFADHSYHGIKNVSRLREGYVAIRTIGGHGILHLHETPAIDLLPDTVLFVESWKLVEYYPKADQWDFWWAEFTIDSPNAAPPPFPLETNLNIPFTQIEDAYFTECLLLLRGDAVLRQQASTFCMLILGHWLQQMQSAASEYHAEIIYHLVQHLLAHPGSAFLVSDMAAFCSLSTRRFRDVFQRVMGCPPSVYALRIRMERAMLLLRDTNAPIYMIAEQTGFADPFYFSRCFSRIYGVSPRTYRNNMHTSDAGER